MSWPLKQTYISPRTKCWRITPQGRKVSFKTQIFKLFSEIMNSWSVHKLNKLPRVLATFPAYTSLCVYVLLYKIQVDILDPCIWMKNKISKLDFPEVRKNQSEFPKHTVFLFFGIVPIVSLSPLESTTVSTVSARSGLGKYARQNGTLPQISGWTFQKYLSCHHLARSGFVGMVYLFSHNHGSVENRCISNNYDRFL